MDEQNEEAVELLLVEGGRLDLTVSPPADLVISLLCNCIHGCGDTNTHETVNVRYLQPCALVVSRGRYVLILNFQLFLRSLFLPGFLV